MTEITETFIDKFDAFASSLDPAERAMLAALLTDDEDEAEVSGFGQSWPGLQQVTVGPGGTGWLKDPNQVTMGPGGNGWLKDPGTDKITLGPGGNGW